MQLFIGITLLIAAVAGLYLYLAKRAKTDPVVNGGSSSSTPSNTKLK